MIKLMRHPALSAIVLCLLAAGQSRAGGVLDQSNVVSTFNFDAAVVGPQSIGQTFTVGIAGLLSQINLEIYKSTNTVTDPTFNIEGTTGGAPDDTKVLYSTTIPLSSIPTFDTPPPGTVPMTSIDVSSANIVVTPGEILALTLSRVGTPGSPPWLLWRQGIGGYTGGNSYDSIPPGTPWTVDHSYEGGFQTFVSSASVPEPSTAILAVIGLGCCAVFTRKAKRLAV
jgi:hypothetical protein